VTFEETLLDGRFGRLRAVVVGPGGALYVSSSNGSTDRILRVTHAGR
jgi:glucose/arabinose dehydrogenase